MKNTLVPTRKNQIQGFIDDATRLRIELIAKRLSNSVTQIEVINWLGNFKPSEHNMALDILEKLEYVSENELIEYLNNRIEHLLKAFSKISEVIVLPVGGFGKSGTLLTYYFKKTKVYKENCKLFKIFGTKHELKVKLRHEQIGSDTILVLLDDFLGSGKSVYKFIKTFIKPLLKRFKKTPSTCILSVYHLNKAETFLNGVYPEIKIISELKFQCFLRDNSPFGYYKSVKRIRDFAYYYGEELFITGNFKKQEKHPLGFKNSQALVIFPYNPPNNTLPIIWSSRLFVKKFDRRWIPLYPRNQQVKMGNAKSMRNELAYELGLLKNMDDSIIQVLYSGSIDLGWKAFNYFKTTDFKLFSYIRLKQQKRVDQTICTILGITLSDLEEIKKEGEARGIIDEVGELTQKGSTLYAESVKQLNRAKKELARKAEYEVYDNVYIPKTFNGRARNTD